MFTGLIRAIGVIERTDSVASGRRFRARVQAPDVEHATGEWSDLEIGESIAVDGVCVTAEELSSAPGGEPVFTFSAGHDTLRLTTLGEARPGYKAHLERALRLSDRLGGHLVAGHVDGPGVLVERRKHGLAVDLSFRVDKALGAQMVPKGSVAIDGVSLTITELGAERFSVMLIPHTREVTHLPALRPGATVNIETDLIGKYVARMLGNAAPLAPSGDALLDLLRQEG
jgi:riboflavin synthase